MRTALTVIVLAMSAPAASAASLDVRFVSGACVKYCEPDVNEITYVAAPGEMNRVEVRAEGPREIVLIDHGAQIAPPPAPCVARSAHEVVCSGSIRVKAQLGDGHDTASVRTPSAVVVPVHGGDGDDVLRVVGGRGDLTGAAGRDELYGGPDGDHLSDGDATAHSDLFDGGGGRDAISYRGRRDDIAVDLADPSTDGALAESDTVRAIEDVWGGSGHNRLVGSAVANYLSGGEGTGAVILGGGGPDDLDGSRGRDRIDGGPGDDRVYDGKGADVVALGPGDDEFQGGAQDDRIDAGAGDDFLLMSPFALPRKRYRCGPGRDTVGLGGNEDLRNSDVVPRGCETVFFDVDATVSRGPPLAAGSRCAYGPCEVRIEVRLFGGRLIGLGRKELGTGERVRGLRPRLTPGGRSLLARRGTLRVRVVFRSDYGDPAGIEGAFTLLLTRR